MHCPQKRNALQKYTKTLNPQRKIEKNKVKQAMMKITGSLLKFATFR